MFSFITLTTSKFAFKIWFCNTEWTTIVICNYKADITIPNLIQWLADIVCEIGSAHNRVGPQTYLELSTVCQEPHFTSLLHSSIFKSQADLPKTSNKKVSRSLWGIREDLLYVYLVNVPSKYLPHWHQVMGDFGQNWLKFRVFSSPTGYMSISSTFALLM